MSIQRFRGPLIGECIPTKNDPRYCDYDRFYAAAMSLSGGLMLSIGSYFSIHQTLLTTYAAKERIEAELANLCIGTSGDILSGTTTVCSNLALAKESTIQAIYKYLFATTPENLHNSLIDVLVCFRCFYALAYNSDPMETNPQFARYCKTFCGL